MTLTPEMLALREAAEKCRQGAASINDFAVLREHYEDLATPTAILALLDQLDAATSPKESALQALVDQAQELDMGYGKGGAK